MRHLTCHQLELGVTKTDQFMDRHGWSQKKLMTFRLLNTPLEKPINWCYYWTVTQLRQVFYTPLAVVSIFAYIFFLIPSKNIYLKLIDFNKNRKCMKFLAFY